MTATQPGTRKGSAKKDTRGPQGGDRKRKRRDKRRRPGYPSRPANAGDPVHNYEEWTQITGPLTEPPADRPYKVQYRRIHLTMREWFFTRLIVLVLVALDARFVVWIITSGQYPSFTGPWWLIAVKGLMVGCSIGMQILLLLNILTVGRACLAARDPVPVKVREGLRVAFLTTIVPGKEPIEMARRTLEAARQIRYNGGPDSRFDVWLLDEGDLQANKDMCNDLGVKYYTRKNRGLEHEDGVFAKKTKHGNYSCWLADHHRRYDVIMMVDTDHVPLPIMAERMLGYFRDPDVAFVVGPQFYGNTGSRVARCAESAQYLFHSVIQRAGNRYGCAMLVGTSAAIRVDAIRKGFEPSITEDLATSWRILFSRNKETGRRWRGVYTPDLTAVGEGPRSWSELFQQQGRWAAGTYYAIRHQVWRSFLRQRPGTLLHYGLMLTYYPSVALCWVMGIVVSSCYLGLGIIGLHTGSHAWLLFYVDVAALQFGLYWYMRRHNVSPHEPQGSSGITGLLLSAFTAPVYAYSALKVSLGIKDGFKTTAKGDGTTPDNLWTFRYHLLCAALMGTVIASAIQHHRTNPMMLGWAVLILWICLAPIYFWLIDTAPNRVREDLADPADAVKLVEDTLEFPSGDVAILRAMLNGREQPLPAKQRS